MTNSNDNPRHWSPGPTAGSATPSPMQRSRRRTQPSEYIVLHERNFRARAKATHSTQTSRMQAARRDFIAADLSDGNDVRRLATRGRRGGHPDQQRRGVRIRPDIRHRRRRFRHALRHQPASAVHPGAEAGPRHDRPRARHRGQYQHRRCEHAVRGSRHLRRQQGSARSADQALGRRVRRGRGYASTPSHQDRSRPRAHRRYPRSSRVSVAPGRRAGSASPTRSPERSHSSPHPQRVTSTAWFYRSMAARRRFGPPPKRPAPNRAPSRTVRARRRTGR